MMRIFAGATDEMRQNFRDNVLSATPRKVKDTLKDYFSAAAKSKAVAVYSAKEKLAEANLVLDEKLIVENLIEE
jgi:Zn-dependent M16 (insulinase) family peptidase